MNFAPSKYFDLSKFAHAALFNEQEPVWSVLSKIGEYLLDNPLGNLLGSVELGAFLAKPEEISIGEGSIVEPGAYILGPCVIGKNCQIRHGAYIRGNVIIGDNCVVGHSTEVKNAILLDGAQAGHFVYVGDSILGNGVNLGAGTKCANLRFDKKNVPVVNGGKRIDSGLRKFGVIMGDGSQTGCNAVTNPGTLLGKECRIAPGATVKGVVPEKTTVREGALAGVK